MFAGSVAGFNLPDQVLVDLLAQQLSVVLLIRVIQSIDLINLSHLSSIRNKIVIYLNGQMD
jgi:hypothetical protein